MRDKILRMKRTLPSPWTKASTLFLDPGEMQKPSYVPTCSHARRRHLNHVLSWLQLRHTMHPGNHAQTVPETVPRLSLCLGNKHPPPAVLALMLFQAKLRFPISLQWLDNLLTSPFLGLFRWWLLSHCSPMRKNKTLFLLLCFCVITIPSTCQRSLY